MDFVAALIAAESAAAVEAVLNEITSTDSEIPADAQIALKSELEKLSDDPVRVNNAKLRRRVKRLITGLDEINARIAANASAAASEQHEVSSAPAEALPPLSILECASAFTSASSQHVVESALNRLSMPDMTSASKQERSELATLQASITTLCESSLPLNKQVRRRLQRLLYVITGGAVKSIAATPMKPQQTTPKTTTPAPSKSTALITSRVTTSKPVMLPTAPCAKSISTALQEIAEATSVDMIEAALSEVNQHSAGSTEQRLELAGVLDALLVNAAINVPSKLKRKMQRLCTSLKEPIDDKNIAAPSTAPTKSVTEAVLPAAASTILATTATREFLSADEVLSELMSCDSSAALDAALGKIDPASILTSHYSAVQEKLKDLLSNSIVNSKLRRRINRLLLTPGVSSVDASATAVEPNTVDTSNNLSQDTQDVTSSHHTSEKTPCIIFLGQLNYHTTKEDIAAHLHTHNITNVKTIRMLTDKKTGKFKGMAFVEFDDAFAMHACLALHHSILKGRRINVEKSCGGSNKNARTEKIVQQKTHQFQKIKEAVDSILTENKLAVTEEYLTKLYSFSPSIVKSMVENFKQVSNDVTVLEKFIDDYHLNNKLVRTVAGVPKKRGHSEATSPVKKKVKREAPVESEQGNMKPWNLLDKDECDSTEKKSDRRSKDSSRKRDLSDIFPSVRGRGGKIGLGSRK